MAQEQPEQGGLPDPGDVLNQQVTLREYEYTPLYEIQKWSEVPAGEPLFNTLLVFENIPLESGGRLMAGTAGLNVQRVAGSHSGETNYPLTVGLVPGRVGDLADHGLEAVEKARTSNVGNFMNTDPIRVDPETNVREVVELMLTNRVGAIPVCDLDTGDLLGIVSYVDVLRAVQETLETT